MRSLFFLLPYIVDVSLEMLGLLKINQIYIYFLDIRRSKKLGSQIEHAEYNNTASVTANEFMC